MPLIPVLIAIITILIISVYEKIFASEKKYKSIVFIGNPNTKEWEYLGSSSHQKEMRMGVHKGVIKHVRKLCQ